MTGDTVELSTYTRALGGTDPHPVSIDALICRLNAQMDDVSWAAGQRGTTADAEAFAESVRELVVLAQSLEGRAAERAEMLRSTAEAVLSSAPDEYEAVMDRIHGGAA